MEEEGGRDGGGREGGKESGDDLRHYTMDTKRVYLSYH